MTLPAHQYRDPLLVVIAEESRTCKGCVHKEMILGVTFCNKKPETPGHKLKRCKFYREG